MRRAVIVEAVRTPSAEDGRPESITVTGGPLGRHRRSAALPNSDQSREVDESSPVRFPVGEKPATSLGKPLGGRSQRPCWTRRPEVGSSLQACFALRIAPETTSGVVAGGEMGVVP